MGLFGSFFKRSVSRDDFAKMVINNLKEHGETRAMQYRSEDFALVLGPDQASLARHFQLFLNASADEHDAVMAQIRQDLQPPPSIDSYSNIRDFLRPVLRSQMQISNKVLALKAEALNTGDELLFPLVGDFVVGIVIDLPRAMVPVVMENVVGWGVPIETVRDDTIRNLPSKNAHQFEEVEPGIYKTCSANGYEASGILSPHLFSSLELGNSLVIVPANADRIWMTDFSKPDNVVKLIKHASESLLKEGRPLSPYLLRLQGDVWEEAKLPTDHPAYQPHQELMKLWFDQIYGAQQTALRKIYCDEDKDPFISTYSIAKRNGQIESYSVWNEDVDIPQWLPRTDTIVLVFNDGEPKPVAWVRLQEIMEMGSTVPVVSNPDRFEVYRFPTKEQLRKLEL